MSKNVEEVLERAVRYAADNRHEYVTIEHLLWSMLDEKSISDLLLNVKSQPAKNKSKPHRLLK